MSLGRPETGPATPLLLRWPVIAVAAVAVVALAAWLWLPRGAADPAEPAGDPMTDDIIAGPPPLDSAPPPAPAPTPAAPEPTEDPRATTQPYATLPSDFGTADLEALRASDAFEVFAEWDRAITVEYSQLAGRQLRPPGERRGPLRMGQRRRPLEQHRPRHPRRRPARRPRVDRTPLGQVQVSFGACRACPGTTQPRGPRATWLDSKSIFDGGGQAVLRSYALLIATEEVDGRNDWICDSRMPAFDLAGARLCRRAMRMIK